MIDKSDIKQWLEEKGSFDCDEQLVDRGVDEVADVIEQCFNDLQPQWVSVDKNKPPYGDPVLIKINGTVQHVTYMLDGKDDYSDWLEPFYYKDLDAFITDIPSKRIEWMPLPK